MTTSLFVYLGIYVLVLFLISFYFSRDESEEDFLIAGRNRKWWQIMFSKYSGTIGAGWFVAYTAFAFEFGFGVFNVLFGLLIGYVWFALWGVPRIRKAVADSTSYTQGDFVLKITNSDWARKVTNWLAALTNSMWLLVAIVGGAKLIEHLGLVSYVTALSITVFVVLAYLLVGGFKAVILTDVVQGVILIGLLGLIGYGMLTDVSLTKLIATETGKMSLGGAIGLLLFGALSPFSSPDRYQLSYAGKNTADTKKGFSYAYVPVLLSAFFLFFVGLFIFSQDPTLDPGLVFSEALRTYLPDTLLPLGILLFFVALMSSADTNIYSLVSHTLLNPNTTNKRKKVRFGLVGLAILAFIVGLNSQDMIDLTILTAAISFITAIPLIYLLGGGKRATVFLSSIAGSVTGVILGIYIVGLEPEAGGFAVLGALIGLALPYLYEKITNM